MGTVRRQSAYATIYAYLGVIVGFISTGMLMPNVFSPEQNGVLKLLVSYSLLGGQMGVLGFKKVISRLFPYFRDRKNEHHGFFFLIIVVFFVGLVFSLSLLLLFKPVILNRADTGGELFNKFYPFLLPLTVLQLMFLLLDQYFTVLVNITKSIFFKDFLQRVLILASVGIFILGWVDFRGFVVLYSAAYSAKALLMLLALHRAGHIFIRPQFHKIDRQRLLSMGHMMLFAFFGGFANIVTFQIDSIMVNKMIGLNETGIYAITFFFGTLIQIPQRSVHKIAIPFVSEAFKNNDRQQIDELNKRTSLNLMVIASLLVIGLWGNIHNVFEILPQEYQQGKYVILFISLTNLVRLSAGLTNRVIGLSPKYAYQTMFVIIHALLIVGTNLLFIPLIGLEGAALASLVSMIIIMAIRVAFSWYHYRTQPFTLPHFGIIAAALMSYGISLLLPHLSNFVVDIIIRSALLVGVYVPIVYLFRFSPDINDFTQQIISNIRRRLK